MLPKLGSPSPLNASALVKQDSPRVLSDKHFLRRSTIQSVRSASISTTGSSDLALVPSSNGDAQLAVREYCVSALGYTNGNVAPFSHPALISDDSWNFMFIHRGRKVGRSLTAPLERDSPEPEPESVASPTKKKSSLMRHSSVCFGSMKDLRSSIALDGTGAEFFDFEGSGQLLRESSRLGPSDLATEQSQSFLQRHSLMGSLKSFRRGTMRRRGKGEPTGGEANGRKFFNLHDRAVERLPGILENIQRNVDREAKERREREALSKSIPHAIQKMIKMSRPLVPKSERNRRAYYGNLFRWAIGRVIARNQEVKVQLKNTAHSMLAELRKERDAKAAKERQEIRCQLASFFFTDLLKRIRMGRGKGAKLDRTKYFQLREKFCILCDSTTNLSLSLKEMNMLMDEGYFHVDPVIFKKLDIDHSGTLEFLELLRVMFPSESLKDMREQIYRWEKENEKQVNSERTQKEESKNKLSAESKEAIANIFRLCDKGRKGVLTRADLALIAPPEWDASSYFPTHTSVMTLDDFTEVVKYGFPPYTGGEFVMERLEGVERRNPLPLALIHAQERATSSL
jgi:hypothetical protein